MEIARTIRMDTLRTLVAVLAILLVVGHTHAASDTTETSDTMEMRWFQYNALKVGPAFFGGDPKGGFIAFESTTPWPRFTTQFSVKYFAGGFNDTDPTGVNVNEHWRLELQWRYYPITPMHEVYFAPLVNYYSTGGFGLGGMMGYQFLFGGRIPLDLSAGIQTGTKTEYQDFPIFLRLGLSVGLAFPKVE